jgi:purine-binding chemotaxis protein CheW
MLVFRLGDGQYAVELASLREIQGSTGLTAVPCTPPHVAGVLNVRGAIVSVIDIAIILGLPKDTERERVVLLDRSGMQIGLLVTEVVGVQRIATDRLDPALSGNDFIMGIAGTDTALVNLGLLLANERLAVTEEVT